MDFHETAAAFLSGWSEGDRTRLLGLLAADVTFSDAHHAVPIAGATALFNYVVQSRARFPQLRFELVATDHHGPNGVIYWRLDGTEESGRSAGCFFVLLNAERRIAEIVGFSDPRPDPQLAPR